MFCNFQQGNNAVPAEHWEDDWGPITGYDDDDEPEDDWGPIAFCEDAAQQSLTIFARHIH